MEMANYNFLAEGKAAGKTFYFSHDPMIYVQTPTYAPGYYAELEWLRINYNISQLSRANFPGTIYNGVGCWVFVP